MRNIIELYVSNDGIHTVRVQTATFEEAERLLPEALRLVDKAHAKHPLGKRFLEEAEASVETPLCKVHGTPMKLRHGPRGDFWSCNQKDEHARWCRETREA